MKRYLLLALCVLPWLSLTAQEIQFQIHHASCGATTGSIQADPSGVWPFTYVWSNGADTQSLVNVPPGVYTVTVTDGSGTTTTGVAEILEIDELFPPHTSVAQACTGPCDGNLQVYLPVPGIGYTYEVIMDPPDANGHVSAFNLWVSNMCIGMEYTAFITRSDGCTGMVDISVESPMQPNLLVINLEPSCAGGATGSASLLFDQLSHMVIYSAGLVDSLTAISNPYTFNNLPPGEYTGSAWYYPQSPSIYQCPFSFSFVIPVSDVPCGQLSGIAFADLDEDCSQGAGEAGVPYKIFSVEPGDHLLITDASGNFATEFPYGTFDLSTAFPDYTTDCTVLPYSFTLDAGNTNETIVLPLAPQFGPDVAVFLNAGGHVPGFPVSYHVTLQNQGPYSFSGMTLDLMFDPLLIPGPVEGSPVLVAPGHYQWTGLDLDAFENIQFEIEFTIPPDSNLLGISVISTAAVSDNGSDEDPANDTYSITRVIVGAYDPNDKLVQTSSGASATGNEYFLDLDSYVDYTIRFQNTGTAPAINVYLLDTVSPILNMLSLQILASSHSFTPSILPDRVLRFDFPGIMLPDSSADMSGSQDFVSFRLKPVDDLMMGDQIVNAADIYFDFNEPIRTNDAMLVAEMSVGIHSLRSDRIAVYPNPALDMLHVQLPDGNWTLEVLSLDGRIQMQHRAAGNIATFGVDRLAAGQYILRTTAGDGTVSVGRFTRH